MYKLYEINYIKADTQEYYCHQIVVSNDIEKLTQKYEEDEDIEGVWYEEVKVKGFEIKINEIKEGQHVSTTNK